MEIVSTMALISINETLLVQLISFLIFLFVINRIMFRPLRSTMAERDFYLEEMALAIEGAQKGYDKAVMEIRAQEEEVRSAARAIGRERERDGSEEAARILEAAREEISRMKFRAVSEVETKLGEARVRIQAESETLADAIVEKILDRRLAS